MDRNYDLADMLVAGQREADVEVPGGTIELYFYRGVTEPVIVDAGMAFVTATGPVYYVAPAAGDVIVCEAWAPS